MTAAVTLSISRPPYASGISAELRPSSPAFFSRSRVMEKSLCSIFSMLGTISLMANSSAVWPMSRCCSVKSSGVKTSSVLRSSRRKLPPEILVCGTAVVVAIYLIESPQPTNFTTEVRRHRDSLNSIARESINLCASGSLWRVEVIVLSCSRKVFKDAGRPHAAAYAHGHEAILRVTPLHFADDRRGELRSCTPQRMTQGNRTAVGIHALRIEPCFFDYRQGLCGKGLVQFDHVDVGELEPCHLQRFGDCEHRTQSHFFWLVSGRSE